MCAYSAISDWGSKQEFDWWTIQRWLEFQKLLDQVKEFDFNIGLPNCEDPQKQVWISSMEDKLVNK